MLSLSKPDQYYQIFLAQGVGSGIALRPTFVPSMAVVSHHFQPRYMLVVAFVASGSWLGCRQSFFLTQHAFICLVHRLLFCNHRTTCFALVSSHEIYLFCRKLWRISLVCCNFQFLHLDASYV
ncbi:hypothetical protein EDB19DRAFT_639028 [Suillus lakei]|nr:hypothetical protein EDB19DRAFT_639028 [Suillus lakei]